MLSPLAWPESFVQLKLFSLFLGDSGAVHTSPEPQDKGPISDPGKKPQNSVNVLRDRRGGSTGLELGGYDHLWPPGVTATLRTVYLSTIESLCRGSVAQHPWGSEAEAELLPVKSDFATHFPAFSASYIHTPTFLELCTAASFANVFHPSQARGWLVTRCGLYSTPTHVASLKCIIKEMKALMVELQGRDGDRRVGKWLVTSLPWFWSRILSKEHPLGSWLRPAGLSAWTSTLTEEASKRALTMENGLCKSGTASKGSAGQAISRWVPR
jgi:hypothetical protein